MRNHHHGKHERDDDIAYRVEDPSSYLEVCADVIRCEGGDLTTEGLYHGYYE
jgi:hypothetical protein